MAPNLAAVHQRLRPDYVLPWIAHPQRILPYTGMPVNIPSNKPVDQKLYPGSSLDQLNGLVDLLMNFERLATEKFSVKPLIKAAPPAADKPPGTDDAAAAGEKPPSVEKQ